MYQSSLEQAIPNHYNRSLFADYYLNNRLDRHEAWAESKPTADRLRQELAALRAGLSIEQLNESQLEEAWIKPVLRLLGHYFGVQINIRYRETGKRTPDYLLMASQEDQRKLTKDIYSAAEIRHALAVADAKQMGIPLDSISGQQRNPSQQIDEYLRYSELPWGILTDGRWWRLYKRESSKYNHFYAVDLLELLNNPSTDFRYFVAFFQREAFAPNGFLSQVARESVIYAEQLSDTLEDQVFSALETVTQGYLEYTQNDLEIDQYTRATLLPQLYSQGLVLLYRLMFMFYAESRAILPLSDTTPHFNANYRRNSLQSKLNDLVDRFDKDKENDPQLAEVYQGLLDRFRWIDKGYDRVGLPPYNGRLFSDEQHPFIANNRIGDLYMIKALDLLARVPHPTDSSQRVFVDYRDLDVRHLGSIYEKLLDFELDVAETDLMLDRDLRYRPHEGSGRPFKSKGELYLRAVDSTHNERKSTGSYYTPDYISRFIIDRSLRPLLDETTATFATLTNDQEWDVHDADQLADAILDLNVLDPAIGSGHFLVDVTAYLAEYLRDLNIRPPDLDPSEDELLYWKRKVVTNCIYGVDINPLAVELAKLALWLATIGHGKPLSFLDHHLRVGNSLVGVRAIEIGANLTNIRPSRRKTTIPEAQISLLENDEVFGKDMGFSVEYIREIEAINPDTVTAVKDQERLYHEMVAQLAPYRQLADVWAARWFGLVLSPTEWQHIRAHFLEGEALPNNGKKDKRNLSGFIQQAQQLAAEHHFFHWDLMFPEIFFDGEGKPKPADEAGFDVVVGNPPYVRQERIMPIKPFLETRFKVYAGTADLFLYFYELGLRFLKPKRRLGFVTSGTFMNSNSAAKFRSYLPQQGNFDVVFNFGENQPFRRAEIVYPTIAIVRRDNESPTFQSYFMEDAHRPLEIGDQMDAVIEDGSITVDSDVLSMPEWRFQRKELTDLYRKIDEAKAAELEHYNGTSIHYGIKTGLNDAFFINEATRTQLITNTPSSSHIIKPLLRGEHLRPWYYETEGTYLLYAYQGIDIELYPAVRDHLLKFKERLENRAGNQAWYELQTAISYADQLERPKLMLPDIGKQPRFSLDTEGYFVNDKGTIIVHDSLALLAVLNSRVIWYALSQIATPLRLRAGLWQYQAKLQFVKRLPIPKLSAAQDTQLAALAEEITGLARQRYQLHEDVRAEIRGELVRERGLNNALTEWWTFADNENGEWFDHFAAQVDSIAEPIPLKRRKDWRTYLAEQRSEHQRLTDAIIAREIQVNGVVYEAFDLTPEEIALIEAETKYPYGSV